MKRGWVSVVSDRGGGAGRRRKGARWRRRTWRAGACSGAQRAVRPELLLLVRVMPPHSTATARTRLPHAAAAECARRQHRSCAAPACGAGSRRGRHRRRRPALLRWHRRHHHRRRFPRHAAPDRAPVGGTRKASPGFCLWAVPPSSSTSRGRQPGASFSARERALPARGSRSAPTRASSARPSGARGPPRSLLARGEGSGTPRERRRERYPTRRPRTQPRTPDPCAAHVTYLAYGAEPAESI